MADPWSALRPPNPTQSGVETIGRGISSVVTDPLQQAVQALRGRLTEREIQDFLWDAAVGVLPGGAAVKGAKAAAKGAGKSARQVGKSASSVDAPAIVGKATEGPMLYGNPNLRGSMNPLEDIPTTYKGKQPKEWTPGEFADVGDIAGVPNLGPLTKPKTYPYAQGGGEFQVPGGTEGKFTYFDMLHNKANPIDPSRVDPSLHADIQRKLSASLTPDQMTPERAWSGLTFGMTSPNNPLFPNQLAASRLRARDPALIQDLAAQSPIPLGTIAPQKGPGGRLEESAKIAQRYGLDAAGKGGLGVRGSGDYTRISDLAKMFQQDPSFFMRQGDETWQQLTERIASQVPGLSMKTGSFGVVWENPAKAMTSAIDRHMGMDALREGTLFTSPGQQADWEGRLIALWNKNNPDRPVGSFGELQRTPGTESAIVDAVLGLVNDARNPKLRLAPKKGSNSGEGILNPKVPEHLREANWVQEPATVSVMGPNYKAALDATGRRAAEHGLGVFAGQHMTWDRIRRRYEPHENMFPGLERMPAMSREQLREVAGEHRASGHMDYTKVDKEGNKIKKVAEGEDVPGAFLRPTKKRPNPSGFGYFGIPIAAGGLAGPLLEYQER